MARIRCCPWLLQVRKRLGWLGIGGKLRRRRKLFLLTQATNFFPLQLRRQSCVSVWLESPAGALDICELLA